MRAPVLVKSIQQDLPLCCSTQTVQNCPKEQVFHSPQTLLNSTEHRKPIAACSAVCREARFFREDGVINMCGNDFWLHCWSVWVNAQKRNGGVNWFRVCLSGILDMVFLSSMSSYLILDNSPMHTSCVVKEWFHQNPRLHFATSTQIPRNSV